MKLQFWSLDAIFAAVIFGTAVIIMTFVWYSVSNQFSITSGYGVEGMRTQLQNAEARILGSGTPGNWNSFINTSNTATWSNISVGLAMNNSLNLSTSKVFTLMAMSNYNYQATKQALGIGYDYYITISNSQFNLSIGSSPFNKRSMSQQVATAPVMVGGSPAVMKIIVWTNTTFGVG